MPAGARLDTGTVIARATGPAVADPRGPSAAPRTVHLLAGGMAAVVLLAVSQDPLRGWLLVALSGGMAGAVGIAARRDGRLDSPAALLFAGAALLVPAYLLWYPARTDLHLAVGPVPMTDVLFISAYAFFVAALARLVRLRDREGERGVHALDSLIISVGVGVLAWVFVISPYMREDTMSGVAKAIAVTYPLLDVLLLGAVVRLLGQGEMSSMGSRLLTAWVGVQLAADLVYTVTSLRGTFSYAGPAPVLYSASFVLLGTAVLHPSALRTEPRAPTAPQQRSVYRRLAIVGAAALIAPAVLMVQGLTGEVRDVPIVALLSAVLFVLVITRIGILMVDVQEHRRIQRQLRRSIREERRQVAENRELLTSLRARQALSERLFRIQRKISTRAPLQEVLDAITAGAAALLRDEVVAIRLVDDDDPCIMNLVSSVGISPSLEPELRRLKVGDGVGGKAVAEDRLCIEQSYDTWDGALAPYAATGLRAAMAAPVHVEGRAVGSLVVATHRERTFSTADQEVLNAFAEHVSLALNDARAVRAMNDALDHAVHQAMHDGLTGLPNRACFYDRTEQALLAARRHGGRTAVLLFDLDRFKEINDTLGHRYGDRVLREIGPRITSVLRETDTLARLGGDEFCVLLPQVTDELSAADVANRIIAALEDPFEIDGMLLAVEASCGITVGPGHGDSADLLLQRADVAMYVAKTSHVDCVVYHNELDVNTPDRLALLGELRAAIARDQLVLHFQPQATLPDGRLEGVEALVRWEHPRLGFLGPDRFVPIAEDTGLIKPLTAWVLDAALAQMRTWLDDEDVELPDGFAMAINLSTRSLLDEGFQDEVLSALGRAGVAAEHLVLEVTETTIMADPARAHRLLTELAAVGVRFAIDDFGTGYSSLASLKVLPVHQLKIDKSFVQHMHEIPNDAKIVRSVIDLGRTLGLRTVAEGVETAEAWTQLGELGCDAAQGYLLARPMPPEELRAWIARPRELAGSIAS